MELTVNRDTVLGALQAASLCLEPKGTIPVLAFAALEMNNGKLKVIGTDLDVTFQTVIEAEGDNGAFCVPVKELTRLVGLFEGDTVSLEFDGTTDRVTVKCVRAKYKLPALKRDAFPNIEDTLGAGFLIGGKMLKSILERVVFCVSTEESRYQMQGVFLETKGGKLYAVATDGYRCALVTYPVPFSDAVSGIVPARAARVVIKTISDEQATSVAIGGDQAKFTQGDTVISARLVVGDFPKYDMIIPKTRAHSVLITTDASNVFRRSAIVADIVSASRAPEIFFNVSKDGIEVNSRNSDKGEGAEFIPANCETLNGDSIPLKFASKYITDMLAHESEINFTFDDNNSQFLLTPAGLREYDYRYVFMPVRI